MKSAYVKDVLRTIQKNAKRFIAIMAITALGLTAFAGIVAACRNMYLAADQFYDRQRLFDVRVLSTLGLTSEDVTALQMVSGVETADGAYSEKVYITVEGNRQSAEMTMLSEKGLNQPYLEAGRLPQAANEIAVTQAYLDATGKAIGDRLDIEEELDTDESGGADAPAKDTPPAPAQDAAADEGPDAGDDDIDTDIDWDADVEVEKEPETPNFLCTQYTITGVVIDPMAVANETGTAAFRSNATTDYSFFVAPAAVHTNVYTAVYLTLDGLAGLDCYSDAYVAAVQEAIGLIEAQIMKQREQARYDAVITEALEKISDAEATMDEKFGEADEQFADAWAEIEDAKQKIVDGEAELTREERDALQKIADARAELEDGRQKLRAAETELAAGEAELEAQARQAQQAFSDEQAKLDAARGPLADAAQQLATPFGTLWPQTQWNTYVGAVATNAAALIAAGADATDPQTAADAAAAAAVQQQELVDALNTMAGLAGVTGTDLADLLSQAVRVGTSLAIVEGGQQVLNSQKAAFEQQIAAARQKIADGRAEITSGWAELAAGEETLNAEEADALRQLADAWQELADSKQKLAEGEAELAENEEKYAEKKAEAEEKLADAYAELADIDMAQWYVQDRTSIDSYSSMDSDIGSIEAIGQAFPVLFLVVALLICLTTMTRMVEEERSLIGAYKALGFGNLAIGWKYILYALMASLAGGVLGNLLGFIALPKLLGGILHAIYVIPNVSLHFDIGYALAGTLLFVASNVVATALACRSELRQTPAALMRPKAPRAGSRILLERIGPVWNHLKFLNKVTARNLFRYKKRLLMTVVGIAGCTALVLAGFAIRDSVTDMMPRQYEGIYRYDLMAVTDADDYDLLQQHLAGDAAIEDYIPAQLDSVKVLNAAGDAESMQLIVVPTGVSIKEYIYTPNLKGEYTPLEDDGILITQNAASLLGLAPGDSVTLQTLQLDRGTAVVNAVVENYLGNNVFIAQTLYEALFGPYKANAAYAHLADTVTDPDAYAQGLLDAEVATSAVSTQALGERFTTDFAILNYVIYILTVLAAGLALVVLFTLSNTNISERMRELATIKVLGFFDREVHSYVNKETLILTLIGVVAGLPLGYAVSGLLLAVLKMPSIQFVLVIQPQSYLIAGVISFSFALLVNLITNRLLDKINMVEALKSVD